MIRSAAVRTDVKQQHPSRECAVCLESFTKNNDITFSFECAHMICVACDDRLVRMAHDRCPLCRSWRQGVTIAQRGAVDRDRAAETLTSDVSYVVFPNQASFQLTDEFLFGRTAHAQSGTASHYDVVHTAAVMALAASSALRSPEIEDARFQEMIRQALDL